MYVKKRIYLNQWQSNSHVNLKFTTPYPHHT